MNIERIRDYCLSKPMATKGFPFGDTTLVFKVMGKIFACIGLDEVVRKLPRRQREQLAAGD